METPSYFGTAGRTTPGGKGVGVQVFAGGGREVPAMLPVQEKALLSPLSSVSVKPFGQDILRETTRGVSDLRPACAALPGNPGLSHIAVLPAGARVHVASQAEGCDRPAALCKPLESLRGTRPTRYRKAFEEAAALSHRRQ